MPTAVTAPVLPLARNRAGASRARPRPAGPHRARHAVPARHRHPRGHRGGTRRWPPAPQPPRRSARRPRPPTHSNGFARSILDAYDLRALTRVRHLCPYPQRVAGRAVDRLPDRQRQVVQGLLLLRGHDAARARRAPRRRRTQRSATRTSARCATCGATTSSSMSWRPSGKSATTPAGSSSKPSAAPPHGLETLTPNSPQRAAWAHGQAATPPPRRRPRGRRPRDRRAVHSDRLAAPHMRPLARLGKNPNVRRPPGRPPHEHRPRYRAHAARKKTTPVR